MDGGAAGPGPAQEPLRVSESQRVVETEMIYDFHVHSLRSVSQSAESQSVVENEMIYDFHVHSLRSVFKCACFKFDFRPRGFELLHAYMF